MRAFALPVALALSMLVLAGCAGKDDAADSNAAAGVIHGVVVDAALRPIPDVVVQVGGAAQGNATTGPDGLFRIGPLAPGAYAVTAAKDGFVTAQFTAEAVPDLLANAVKVVLEQLASARPYVETFLFEGYIECGTSSAALCAAPNYPMLVLCDTAGTCLGNVTNDRFNVNHVPAGVPDWVQSELVWTPTLDASDRLYFSVSHYVIGEESQLETLYNSTVGVSPLLLTVAGNATRDSGLGLTEGYRQSVFAGAIDGTTPPGCAPPCTGPGFAVQQRFNIYTHFFYHFQPPPGWRFTESDVPLPPGMGA